jgi:hypothetical protein
MSIDASIDAAITRVMAKLQAKYDEADKKSHDRYWNNGPYNVQRWVARGYGSAMGTLKEAAPLKQDSPRTFLLRVAEMVRSQRDLGPDADDESWYASAMDDAARIISDG